MADDIATIWGGVPRIGHRTANGEILIGNGEHLLPHSASPTYGPAIPSVIATINAVG